MKFRLLFTTIFTVLYTGAIISQESSLYPLAEKTFYCGTSDVLWGLEQFEYDKDQQLIRRIYTGFSVKFYSSSTYSYNESQLTSKLDSIQWDGESMVVSNTEYFYDCSGNMTFETNSRGKIHRYYYDSNNNLIRKVSGDTLTGSTVLYEVDEKGRRIKETHPGSRKGFTILKYEENLLKSSTYFNYLDNTTTTQYIHNENGELTEIIEDGKKLKSIVYKDGRLLEEQSHHTTGTPCSQPCCTMRVKYRYLDQ